MAHSNLLITLTPSQSAYFAGERFSCTISFTNTSTPAPPPPPLAPLYKPARDPRSQPSTPVSATYSAPSPVGRPASHRSASSSDEALHGPRTAPLPLSPLSPYASQRQPRAHRSATSLHEVTSSYPYTYNDDSPVTAHFPSPISPGQRHVTRGKKQLPTRQGLVGKSTFLNVSGPTSPFVNAQPPLPRRPLSHLRTQSINGLSGALRSASLPDLLLPDQGAGSSGGPSSAPGRWEGHSPLGGRASPGFSRKSSMALIGGTLPTAHEEEETCPSGSAAPPPSTPPSSFGSKAPRSSPLASQYSSTSPARPDRSTGLPLSKLSLSLTVPSPDPDAAVASMDASPEQSTSHAGSRHVSGSMTPRASGEYMYNLGRNDTMESVIRDRVADWAGAASSPTNTTPLALPFGRFEGHRRTTSMYSDASSARNLGVTASAPAGRSSFLLPRSGRGAGQSGGSIGVTEHLLWAFAKLEASFEVDDRLVKNSEFTAIKRALASPASPALYGMGGGLVGGGSLEGEPIKPAKGTWPWSGWLFGAGPAPLSSGYSTPLANNMTGDFESDLSNSASAKVSNGYFGGGGRGTEAFSGSLEARRQRVVGEKSVPMFDTPPSVLGVDIKLQPGETKTFSFSIGIPADLPPSFKGRAIRFNYNLVLGTHKSSPRISLSSGGRVQDRSSLNGSQLSRVMKVPIRVYNHVSMTGARPFYDLTNPIVYVRDEATSSCISDDNPVLAPQALVSPTNSLGLQASDSGVLKKASTARDHPGGQKEFSAYAAKLLDALASPQGSLGPESALSLDSLSPSSQFQDSFGGGLDQGPQDRPEMASRLKAPSTSSVVDKSTVLGVMREGKGDDDSEGGCRGSVEMATRTSSKMSFNINKDGCMVAQLTLVKSAFRLGESIDGMIWVNQTDGRVLRFSARLETQELVETSISTLPANQMLDATRRLYSEHHESTLDSCRIGFSLGVPSGASPDFATSGVKLQWTVRLTLLVVPPSKTPIQVLPRSSGHVRAGSISGGGAAANSSIPRSLTSSHGRSKSFAYGFEPKVAVPPTFVPTGSPHLFPYQASVKRHNKLGSRDFKQIEEDEEDAAMHTIYRGVPDLSFVPILYGSTTTTTTTTNPSVTSSRLSTTASSPTQKSGSPQFNSSNVYLPPVQPQVTGNVVLIPAKVETVECSIPIRVYPGNTPFKPTVTTFYV